MFSIFFKTEGVKQNHQPPRVTKLLYYIMAIALSFYIHSEVSNFLPVTRFLKNAILKYPAECYYLAFILRILEIQ